MRFWIKRCSPVAFIKSHGVGVFLSTAVCPFHLSELICTKCLHVRDVTSQSAMLHWQPILIHGLGQYELQYGETGRSIETYRKLTLSPDHIWIELTDLQPETHYSVRLTAHTPYSTHSRTLSASFTTLPGEDESLHTDSSFCHKGSFRLAVRGRISAV